MKHALHLLFFVMTTGAWGAFPDSTFTRYADTLFNLPAEEQQTYIRIYSSGHTYFLVTTCKTIDAPYGHVRDALQNIASYKDYFKFMKRFGFVHYEDIGDSVALFEAGVAFYVAWYAGRITCMPFAGNNECRLICGNIDQRLFRKEWSGRIHGLVRISSHDVHLEWHLRDLGGGKTRVALTVSQAPAVLIPKWLLKIAAGAIFPGMLGELEKALR